jgi:hypothetical protein
LLPPLRRERHLKNRITGTEDLGEHPLRKVAGEHEPVDTALPSELATLVQRE